MYARQFDFDGLVVVAGVETAGRLAGPLMARNQAPTVSAFTLTVAT